MSSGNTRGLNRDYFLKMLTIFPITLATFEIFIELPHPESSAQGQLFVHTQYNLPDVLGVLGPVHLPPAFAGIDMDMIATATRLAMGNVIFLLSFCVFIISVFMLENHFYLISKEIFFATEKIEPHPESSAQGELFVHVQYNLPDVLGVLGPVHLPQA